MELDKNSQTLIVKQSILIGLTKLIALSMPMIDLVMLAHWSTVDALSDYSFITHLVQIFVVMTLALSIGVPIFFNQSENQKSAIRRCLAYALVMSVLIVPLITVFFYALDWVNHFNQIQTYTYFSLVAGIVTLPTYVVISHVLDAMGQSKKMIYLTAILSIVNLLINYYYIFIADIQEQLGVAIATSAVRVLGLIIILLWLLRLFGSSVLIPKFDKKSLLSLMRLGRSDLVTGMAFSGGFALLSFYLSANYSSKLVGEFGILLNIINIVFVFYIGFAAALSIHLSKHPSQKHELLTADWDYFILKSIAKSFIVGLLVSPIVTLVYFYPMFADKLVIVGLAITIAVLDGLAIALISRLRVVGYAKYPPLTRLMLILFGIPLGVCLLPHMDILGVLLAFALANGLVALVLILYSRVIFRRLKQV
ncbi:MATE family efflux transporter [Moraxella pluranimalium]|uniref:MATE family efflux transporter n=1 Tax=Moraxella pluranimalium TaxID=470453 RepID=A0A1T0CKS6_9GAMM|nr:MATE family efflux transporter [Moraxella pluranimalium]OOS22924.1 hypothetical protein B0680_08905 [Moraxella pluranimalium]